MTPEVVMIVAGLREHGAYPIEAHKVLKALSPDERTEVNLALADVLDVRELWELVDEHGSGRAALRAAGSRFKW